MSGCGEWSVSQWKYFLPFSLSLSLLIFRFLRCLFSLTQRSEKIMYEGVKSGWSPLRNVPFDGLGVQLHACDLNVLYVVNGIQNR